MSLVYRDETFNYEDYATSGSVDVDTELLWVDHRLTVEFDLDIVPTPGYGFVSDVIITSIKTRAGVEILSILEASVADDSSATSEIAEVIADALTINDEGRASRDREARDDYLYQQHKERSYGFA